ncbi:MAG: hypothetical protein WCS01_04620, partial [bacterium]
IHCEKILLQLLRIDNDFVNELQNERIEMGDSESFSAVCRLPISQTPTWPLAMTVASMTTRHSSLRRLTSTG